MNISFIKHFFVGFMISEIYLGIPRVSVFGYFPLRSIYVLLYTIIIVCIRRVYDKGDNVIDKYYVTKDE